MPIAPHRPSAPPPRRVVALAHDAGPEGERIGRLVGERLGARYAEPEIVARAALRSRVEPGRIAAAAHPRPLRERVRRRLERAMAAQAGDAGLAAGELMSDEELRELVRAAIVELADEGGAVIISPSAAAALAGRDDVLRVFVTASPGRSAGYDLTLRTGALGPDGAAELILRAAGVPT